MTLVTHARASLRLLLTLVLTLVLAVGSMVDASAAFAQEDAPAREVRHVPDTEPGDATGAEGSETEPDDPPTDEDRYEDDTLFGPILVMSAGALVAAGGGLVLGIGLADKSAVENASVGTRWADVRDAYDRAPTMITVGELMIGGGLALVAAGLTWLVLKLAGVRDYEPTARAGLRIGPGGLAFGGLL